MLVGNSSHRRRGVALLLLVVSLLAGASTASARQTAVKAVRYHGYVLKVPRAWKVYDLSRDPRVCVRFDRHAVYLGAPSAQQRCPAHAIGRTEAILVQPATALVRRALAHSAAVADSGLPRVEGSATTFVARPAGVAVTATWGRDESVVARALGQKALRANGIHAAAPARAARARSAAATPARPRAAVFGGLGFDACSTPSPASMAAWNASPYRAVGIYIGGVNAACSQPNLTSTWVAGEVAAGWHMVPIYVGLQAPSNGCRCAAISPSQAAAQGAAAAVDAVADAQGIGIPAGNPIYNDMEGYTRSSANTAAVLAFLSAWTAQLHAEGYVSGVYSSSGSGISDLAAQFGTTYIEPDDIWFAEWNNEQTVTSTYVPPADWANNQRLHQYRGGHNETYGGVTINIDNDFLDGATADTSGTLTNVLPPPPPPTLKISPGSDGTTSLTASWNGGSGVASWRVLAGPSPTSAITSVASAPSGASSQISVRSAAGAFAVQALDATGQVLATSPGIATPAHITIYGHSVFAPATTGTGGIPVGCYTSATCHVKTTVFAGRTTIARTGQEHVGANGTGIVFFKLTSKGRSLLSHARGHRLAVNVKVQDSRGAKALSKMSLIPFATTGAGPHRSLTQASPLKLVGLTDFVSGRGVGGILAGCNSPSVCAVTTVVSVGRTVIARTGRELIGGNELGYLIFSLTSHGRALLANAHGNQLGARVTITQGTVKASGGISLVHFS